MKKTKPINNTDFERVIVNGYPDYHYEVGDRVFDELTNTICRVVRIYPKVGPDSWQGDWVQITSPHLEGARHPWEISKVKKGTKNG